MKREVTVIFKFDYNLYRTKSVAINYLSQKWLMLVSWTESLGVNLLEITGVWWRCAQRGECETDFISTTLGQATLSYQRTISSSPSMLTLWVHASCQCTTCDLLTVLIYSTLGANFLPKNVKSAFSYSGNFSFERWTNVNNIKVIIACIINILWYSSECLICKASIE